MLEPPSLVVALLREVEPAKAEVVEGPQLGRLVFELPPSNTSPSLFLLDVTSKELALSVDAPLLSVGVRTVVGLNPSRLATSTGRVDGACENGQPSRLQAGSGHGVEANRPWLENMARL